MSQRNLQGEKIDQKDSEIEVLNGKGDRGQTGMRERSQEGPRLHNQENQGDGEIEVL